MRQSMIKGMVKYKVEDRSKNTNFRSYIQLYKYDSNDNPQEEKDETVMMSLYTERHGIQRGKKKEDVTGRCPVTFSFHLIL